MIVDELRDSIAIYGEMLLDGERDPLTMLNIVDKRLADVSNHIAVCHRVIAEQRGLASVSFFGGARKHLAKAEQAGETLEQVMAVQSDFFEFRHKVLSRVAEYLRGSAPVEPTPWVGLTQGVRPHGESTNESIRSSPEKDDTEAQLVLKARTACEVAEMSLAEISDEYEKERFEKYISKAEAFALSISDPFYKSAALHPIVTLLSRAGDFARSSRLLEHIQDDSVRSTVEQELQGFRNAS